MKDLTIFLKESTGTPFSKRTPDRFTQPAEPNRILNKQVEKYERLVDKLRDDLDKFFEQDRLGYVTSKCEWADDKHTVLQPMFYIDFNESWDFLKFFDFERFNIDRDIAMDIAMDIRNNLTKAQVNYLKHQIGLELEVEEVYGVGDVPCLTIVSSKFVQLFGDYLRKSLHKRFESADADADADLEEDYEVWFSIFYYFDGKDFKKQMDLIKAAVEEAWQNMVEDIWKKLTK